MIKLKRILELVWGAFNEASYYQMLYQYAQGSNYESGVTVLDESIIKNSKQKSLLIPVIIVKV